MSYMQLALRGERGTPLLNLQLFEIIWNTEDKNNMSGKADKKNPAQVNLFEL